MAYSDFALEDIPRRLGYQTHGAELFPALRPVPVPGWLTDWLSRNTLLALSSEKARGEDIISPVLKAAREQSGDRLAIYSGQRLDSDSHRGLVGECDFILSISEPIPPLRSPIITIVEAKKADIELGLGQCIAQMVGAKVFNDAAGEPERPVFGCVTNGEGWQFLRLDENTAAIDTKRYYSLGLGSVLAAFGEIVARCDAAVSR